MNDIEFLTQQCETLNNEIKRLKFENRNTIKIPVSYNGTILEVDTQISKPLKENQIYYYPDSNIDPTPLKLIDYQISQGVAGAITICALCVNQKNNELEYYLPKNLFPSKSKASQEYLENKFGKGNNEI